MKKGFTLIELLVFIAIIGILAAIVIVGMSGPKEANTDSSISGFQSTDVGVTLPEPTNYLVDTTGSISADDTALINSSLKGISDTGNLQVGVLVTESTKPLTIEQYSIRLGEKWKTGFAGKDNGAIIIIATKDRKVRIETGHGLTGQVTDVQAKAIIENDMKPFLKDGNWAMAIMAGISGLNKLVK